MKKSEALAIFGSVRALAEAVGVTRQAVAQWRDPLPPRIEDRLVAAVARLRAVERDPVPGITAPSEAA